MSDKYMIDYQSPIGLVEITGTEEGVYSVLFTERDILQYPLLENTPKSLIDCYQQLDLYFKGELETFTFPYIVEGTDFQKMCGIHYRLFLTVKPAPIKTLQQQSVMKRQFGQLAVQMAKISFVLFCHVTGLLAAMAA